MLKPEGGEEQEPASSLGLGGCHQYFVQPCKLGRVYRYPYLLRRWWGTMPFSGPLRPHIGAGFVWAGTWHMGAHAAECVECVPPLADAPKPQGVPGKKLIATNSPRLCVREPVQPSLCTYLTHDHSYLFRTGRALGSITERLVLLFPTLRLGIEISRSDLPTVCTEYRTD